MTTACIWPAEYEPDSGVNPPPYIVWDSAEPPFVPQLTLPTNRKTAFTVTVGDADVNQTLTVRFCARKDTIAGTAYVLVNTEKEIAPTRDHTVDRPALTSDPFDVCTVFNDTGATHYIYVFVTDGSFLVPGVGCDLTSGAGYAQAAWSFTCTDI